MNPILTIIQVAMLWVGLRTWKQEQEMQERLPGVISNDETDLMSVKLKELTRQSKKVTVMLLIAIGIIEVIFTIIQIRMYMNEG